MLCLYSFIQTYCRNLGDQKCLVSKMITKHFSDLRGLTTDVDFVFLKKQMCVWIWAIWYARDVREGVCLHVLACVHLRVCRSMHLCMCIWLVSGLIEPSQLWTPPPHSTSTQQINPAIGCVAFSRLLFFTCLLLEPFTDHWKPVWVDGSALWSVCFRIPVPWRTHRSQLLSAQSPNNIKLVPFRVAKTTTSLSSWCTKADSEGNSLLLLKRLDERGGGHRFEHLMFDHFARNTHVSWGGDIKLHQSPALSMQHF